MPGQSIANGPDSQLRQQPPSMAQPAQRYQQPPMQQPPPMHAVQAPMNQAPPNPMAMPPMGAPPSQMPPMGAPPMLNQQFPPGAAPPGVSQASTQPPYGASNQPGFPGQKMPPMPGMPPMPQYAQVFHMNIKKSNFLFQFTISLNGIFSATASTNATTPTRELSTATKLCSTRKYAPNESTIWTTRSSTIP